MSKLKIYLLVALAVVAVGLWSYAGPATVDVKIIDTEVHRVGTGETSYDQKRIGTIRVSDGSTLVFRNEDAIMLPPYLKYDSADLQTLARSNAERGGKGPTVRIKYYGWRIKLFSMFPNATNLWVVEEVTAPVDGETAAPGASIPGTQ